MQWRNPKDELPPNNSKVWILLEPHKDRGSFYNSAESMEVVCGEVRHYPPTNEVDVVIVQNNDELGMGSIDWCLKCPEDDRFWTENAIAWIPLEEFPKPEWL